MINCKKCNYWQSKDRTIGLCLKNTEQNTTKNSKHTIMKTLYCDFGNGFISTK